MTSGQPKQAALESAQVRALRFAVAWTDQHPVTWLDDAFPQSYEVSGWALTVTETQLMAEPPEAMFEQDARSALAPILDTWSAALEVRHSLRVRFSYQGADFLPQATDTGTITSADIATAKATAYGARVDIHRPAPPEPDWSWRETDETRLARERCLLPLRSGTRPVADAAYWLATHLEEWADRSKAKAAERLNVSVKYFEQFRTLSATSSERKVMPSSQVLTPQQKQSLAAAAEELILRLHLAESGLDLGPHLTREDWPSP